MDKICLYVYLVKEMGKVVIRFLLSSKLGEPGYIPPDNGPGGKIAAIAGLAALAYDNRQQHPEFPQINQEQNSGVLIFTNINAEQRKEKKGK